ncbi:outer membrane receptor protein involved in Fe transport [Chitinophaga skermanii]|uniref:Outer membrane receptor protein involved in Fe transport n=1 Tax=Chitinophaga skermanii TaxID=331697 RepID=A0A327R5B8_9BACT|nr:TonB-dependent receptor [Chitinophaga skermanii]RAJ11162.1 outer membrane receptor protein involved in Fe transport [Chitinophaga skermanii]
MNQKKANRTIKWILLLFMFSCHFGAFAQNSSATQYVTMGTLLLEQRPLVGAMVQLHRTTDSVRVRTVFTDSIGQFTLVNIPVGAYFLVIQSSIQTFQPVAIQIEATANHIIPPILLDNKVQQLNTVTVQAKKPIMERKIDRIIFHTEQMQTLAGGTLLDVLTETPGVRVNEHDISLVAKSSVKVMINDKIMYLSGQDLLNYLRSLPAENIASIEVITMPPAQYDAAGNAGIINIRTKRIKQDGWSAMLSTAYTQTTYVRGGTGLLLNYQTKKVALYANTSMSEGSKAPNYFTQLYYPKQTWDQLEHRKDRTGNFNYQAGIDYNPSPKTTMGLAYMGAHDRIDLRGVNTILMKDLSAQLDSTINTISRAKGNSDNGSLNLSFKHTFPQSQRLTVNADYFFQNSHKTNDYQTTNYLPGGNLTGTANVSAAIGNQEIDVQAINADFEMPIGKAKLTIGAKATFIQNRSMNEIDDSRNIQVITKNQFTYKENTQAAYLNYHQSIGKGWELQAGLRGEYTRLDGYAVAIKEQVKQDYFKIFPTLYVVKTINDDNVVALNYGRRIDRPGYALLNPFKWYSSAYSYSVGNPFLLPSFNHNAELSYTFKSNYSLSLYFQETENKFSQIENLRPDTNLIELIYRNFLTSYSLGANISAVVVPVKGWNMTNNVSVYQNMDKSDLQGTIPRQSILSAFLSTSNSITLNKKKTLIASLSYWYQFPEISNYSKFEAYSNMNIGVRALFLEKRLAVNIAVRDIFKTQQIKFSSIVNGVEKKNSNYYDARSLGVTISYKIGKKEAKRKQQNSNQDAIDRAAGS